VSPEEVREDTKSQMGGGGFFLVREVGDVEEADLRGVVFQGLGALPPGQGLGRRGHFLLSKPTIKTFEVGALTRGASRGRTFQVKNEGSL